MTSYPPFKVSSSERDDNNFMKCYLGCGTPLIGGRPRNDSQYECWDNCRFNSQSQRIRAIDEGRHDAITHEEEEELRRELATLEQGGGYRRKKRTRRRRKTRRRVRRGGFPPKLTDAESAKRRRQERGNVPPGGDAAAVQRMRAHLASLEERRSAIPKNSRDYEIWRQQQRRQAAAATRRRRAEKEGVQAIPMPPFWPPPSTKPRSKLLSYLKKYAATGKPLSSRRGRAFKSLFTRRKGKKKSKGGRRRTRKKHRNTRRKRRRRRRK